MALISFPNTLSLSFVRFKWLPIIWLLMTALVVAGSLAWKGLNFGIDFKGGVVMEVQFPEAQNLDTLRTNLKYALQHDVSLQALGKENTIVLLKTESTENDEALLQEIKQVLGSKVEYRRVEAIGPKVGKELIRNGLMAIGYALLSIMAYVWFRFEWQFSVCAGLALLHDCLSILGFFSLLGYELTENAIVAILITAAYSINDTVVIFDRLRENLARNQGMPFLELINKSINETLSRTIFTSVTTMLALGVLYWFGGEVIASFSLPILVGIGFGTFSSIVIAVPLLQWLPQIRSKSKNPLPANIHTVDLE